MMGRVFFVNQLFRIKDGHGLLHLFVRNEVSTLHGQERRTHIVIGQVSVGIAWNPGVVGRILWLLVTTSVNTQRGGQSLQRGSSVPSARQVSPFSEAGQSLQRVSVGMASPLSRTGQSSLSCG
jgi:hypothetical protein